MDDFILISFESVNFAIQAESVFKKENVIHQMMPTPREITLSCGLSIQTPVDNVDKIKKLVEENKINIKKLYIVKNTASARLIQEYYE